MRTVEEIKAAAAALNPDQQAELFEWWVHTESFKKRQLEKLKAEIAKGIADLDSGNYRVYTDETLMQLSEEIGRSGRERLKALGRKKRA